MADTYEVILQRIVGQKIALTIEAETEAEAHAKALGLASASDAPQDQDWTKNDWVVRSPEVSRSKITRYGESVPETIVEDWLDGLGRKLAAIWDGPAPAVRPPHNENRPLGSLRMGSTFGDISKTVSFLKRASGDSLVSFEANRGKDGVVDGFTATFAPALNDEEKRSIEERFEVAGRHQCLFRDSSGRTEMRVHPEGHR